MPKALVTGADGFTGRHLAPELAARGFEVHGVVRHPLPVDTGKLLGFTRLHVCNLLNSQGLQTLVKEVKPTVVAHLAGIAFVAHGDADDIYRINIIGSRSLLAALANVSSSIDCVLMASSANVYGNATQGVIDETVPPAPVNDYAVSKLAMEFMARTWFDRLPVTIARPFNYTGVGQSQNFLLPKIVKHYRERAAVLELGNIDVERDFSDVRMVVDVYARLLVSPQPCSIFNVCSGTSYSLRDILHMAEHLSGHPLEIRANPALVRVAEVRKLVGNRSALEQAIGSMKDVPLIDTLRWMLE